VLDWAHETRADTAIAAGAKPIPVPIAPPTLTGSGAFRLCWQSQMGTAYQVQSTDSLLFPRWKNLDSVVIGLAGSTTNEIPTAERCRFFRVVIGP